MVGFMASTRTTCSSMIPICIEHKYLQRCIEVSYQIYYLKYVRRVIKWCVMCNSVEGIDQCHRSLGDKAFAERFMEILSLEDRVARHPNRSTIDHLHGQSLWRNRKILHLSCSQPKGDGV